MAQLKIGSTIGGYLIPVRNGDLQVNLNAEMINGKRIDDTKSDSNSLWTAAKITTQLGDRAPTSHASTATTYGVADASNYGHVKTGDGIAVSNGTISANIGTGLAFDSSMPKKFNVSYGSTSGTAVEGNKSITITANNGLTGGGTVTLGSGGTITVSHADTSSQASVDNSGNNFIQDITLDAYGHITAITSAATAVDFNVSSNYGFKTVSIDNTETEYTWATADSTAINAASSGDTLKIVASKTGSTSGIDVKADVTNKAIAIAHADTSTLSSGQKGTAGISSITVDEMGHVTAVGAATYLTSYTETDTLQSVTDRGATTTNAVTISNATAATNTSTGALVVAGGTGIGGALFVGGNLTISGNLIVNGTTSTVNSNTVTVDDPIITLGGDTAPTNDDAKDRGVEFRWHNGTTAKIGFFGFDDSTGKFTFIPDATNTSEVFSGTIGTIDAKIDWSNVVNPPSAYIPNVNNFGTVTVIDSGTYTWAATGSAVADSTSDTLTLLSGGGINIDVDATNDAIKIEHADTSSVGNLASDNSGNTFIQDINFTFDTYGHVTAASVTTATVTQSNDFSTVSIGADSGYTWGAANTNTSQVADSNGDTLTLVNGTAINLYTNTVAATDAIKIEHADTSTLSGAQGGSGIASITVDGLGHVTAVTTATYLTSQSNDFGAVVIGTDSGYTWGAANTNTNQVADATGDTLTLVSGGAINLYASTVASTDAIKIEHADTSTQASVDNSGNTFIQDITLDGYGHVTALGSGSIDFTVASNYAFQNVKIDSTDTEYTWVTADGTTVAADSNADTVTIVAGGAIDVAADATNDAVKISHKDTSSVADLSSATNTFITAQTYDTYGHVLTRTTGTVDFTVAANYAFQNVKIDNSDAEYTWVTTDGTTASADSNNDNLIIVASKTVGTYGIQVKADANLDAIGIAHADTSTLTGAQGTGGIASITVDEMGHVTAVTTATYSTSATNTTLTQGDLITITDSGTGGAHVYKVEHNNITAPTPTTNATRTYINSLTFDGHGHITGYTTNTESDQTTVSGDKYLSAVTGNGNSTSVKFTITNGTDVTWNASHTHTNDHSAGSDNQNLFSHIHVYSTGTTDVTNSPHTASSITDHMEFRAGTNVTLSMDSSGVIDITASDTATAIDNILDGSNSGTAITYAPYSAQQAKLSFDTSAANPTRSDRLNLNGYLYATKLYSGGVEVSVIGHTHDTLSSPTIDNIADNNGNEVLKFSSVTNAVNEITVTNAATTNAPKISATGGDTNIDLQLEAKGTGIIKTTNSISANSFKTTNWEIIQDATSQSLKFMFA